jgi:hypothetical protein
VYNKIAKYQMQFKDEYNFSFLELEYKHTEKYSIKYLAFCFEMFKLKVILGIKRNVMVTEQIKTLRCNRNLHIHYML